MVFIQGPQFRSSLSHSRFRPESSGIPPTAQEWSLSNFCPPAHLLVLPTAAMLVLSPEAVCTGLKIMNSGSSGLCSIDGLVIYTVKCL